MAFLKKFWPKRKEVKETKEEVKKEKTPLEEMCASEPEIYEALSHTMFLDPRKIGTSLTGAIENAKEAERSKDNSKALSWWKIAGGLAIFEGNIKKVKECFGKCAKLDPASQPKILESQITEKAVAKAQEYYKKHLVSEGEAKKDEKISDEKPKPERK